MIENFKGIKWIPNKDDPSRRGIGTNARFVSERFKEPKFTKGWHRKKTLPKF